mmetsp:Transcript_4815/g.14608  ORF Transcript_4815/g.14608 Transcript_4815/m.14608 type:complete len:87 (-) Transcript_4815:68-328(-)|eukprot:36223-Chlamydomonas_euryale.AAC.8
MSTVNVTPNSHSLQEAERGTSEEGTRCKRTRLGRKSRPIKGVQKGRAAPRRHLFGAAYFSFGAVCFSISNLASRVRGLHAVLNVST